MRLLRQDAVIGGLYRSWAVQRSRTRFRFDYQELFPLETELSDAASIEMVALNRELSTRQDAMLSAGRDACGSKKHRQGRRLGDARQRAILRTGELTFAVQELLPAPAAGTCRPAAAQNR